MTQVSQNDTLTTTNPSDNLLENALQLDLHYSPTTVTPRREEGEGMENPKGKIVSQNDNFIRINTEGNTATATKTSITDTFSHKKYSPNMEGHAPSIGEQLCLSDPALPSEGQALKGH